MKYLLTIPACAFLLGAGVVASGEALDASAVIAILFASSLLAWFLAEYRVKGPAARAPRRSPAAQPERRRVIRKSSAPAELLTALTQQ